MKGCSVVELDSTAKCTHLKYAPAAGLCLVALHFVLVHHLQRLLPVLAQQDAQLGQRLQRDWWWWRWCRGSRKG